MNKNIQSLHSKKSRLKNQRGMAILETIPILVVFITIIAYGLGFFGVVHTGILNSIAARTYAFETFRNRANVVLFRDRATGQGFSHYANKETRLHVIKSENDSQKEFPTTSRPIAFGRRPADNKASVDTHNVKIINKGSGRFRREDGLDASPAWIMVGYGICVNASCGD